MSLLLRAVDVAGPLRWRWLLTDADTGEPLADHPVDLGAAPAEVARFADLHRYMRSYAIPDRRVEDGARLVAETGAWAGAVLIGDAVGKAIVNAAAAGPVTVRVVAPPPADSVLLWPLELAHAGGRPLAARGDVAFVYQVTDALSVTSATLGGVKAPVSDELRVLAVFSQPTETSILALRRERYALAQLMRHLGRERAKITLKVAQYGVTRQRLGEIADDGDGWDVLHLSGHGAGGVFLLEKADGSPDLVSAADLVTLLRPARRRVKLAVLSACESAADTTAETYRLLGLNEQAEALESTAQNEGDGTESVAAASGATASGTDAAVSEADPAASPAKKIPGLARELARELRCDVVAMRYPVTDEFAIAFGGVLYEQVLARKQPVDIAVARAVADASRPDARPSASRPAISIATPGVFSLSGAGTRIEIPRGRPVFDPAGQKMAYFPDEPARFVGRAAPMAKASAALAPGSGQTGILLHGMAGAGKTACALELAYRHQDAFSALAFWQAPTRDEQWASGLADFANRLDIQLADYGFTMAAHIATEATLRAFAPRLRSLLADAGLLLVLDNLETLLTPEGIWRDPRWSILLTALTTHDGESRAILTSRIPPSILAAPARAINLTRPVALAGSGGFGGSGDLVGPSGATAPLYPALGLQPTGLDTSRVLTLPVHALSLAESVALARELPNLRKLLHADPGPDRPPATLNQPGFGQAEAIRTQAEADRDRVLRVLRVVQGHPKLMELADAAASDPARLDRQLAAAEQAASQAAEPPRSPAGASTPPEETSASPEATAELPASTAEAPNGLAGPHELDAFFRDGETTLDPEGFLAALADWTRSALTALSPQARLMAEFIACLEDTDRRSDIIEPTWPGLWQRLNAPESPARPHSGDSSEASVGTQTAGSKETSSPQASGTAETPAQDQAADPAAPTGNPGEASVSPNTGDSSKASVQAQTVGLTVHGAPQAGDAGHPPVPPAPRPLLDALATAALVEAEPIPDAAGQAGSDEPGADSGLGPVAYRMHPGVGAAVASAASPGVRAAADAELAAFWRAVFDGARQREDGEDGEDGALVVRAGLAAAPYLLRRQEWDTAGGLLERAAARDWSPGLAQAVLPSLRRLAAATGAPAHAVVLARVLARVDPAEAERLLRGAVDAAAGAGDYRVATAGAGELFYLLLGAGQLAEALAVAVQKAGYTRRAGLGPWTQLADQARLLQVLGLMGDHARVLAEAGRLRAAMAALPARRGSDEAADPWSVREVILGTAHISALATGEWARCLELNAEVAASVRGRGAGVHEVTRTRLSDAGPLMRLGRLGEAGRLLAECQRVFEEHADTAMLSLVLSARADLEASLGRPGMAADLERAALRLSYARPEPRDIAAGHHNLANYLGRLGGDRAARRAHRLAAALIFRLAGMAHDLANAVGALAGELREGGGADPSLPSTAAGVVEVAEQTEGVRLAALLTALQPDPAAIESALSEILRDAAAAPETPPTTPPQAPPEP